MRSEFRGGVRRKQLFGQRLIGAAMRQRLLQVLAGDQFPDVDEEAVRAHAEERLIERRHSLLAVENQEGGVTLGHGRVLKAPRREIFLGVSDPQNAAGGEIV